tara:strand:+ start:7314 stop:7883 length:570 start_codon:yes stop_codon:yes gene_type:complete
MFILPIFLTYLTTYINLPSIFENWEYSIITSLLILVGILIYELFTLNDELKDIRNTPKKGDKKIVCELLETLNLDKFHEEIVCHDAWNGYDHESIYRIIEFQEKAKLIGYKTSNKKLNALINTFVIKLDDFTDYSSLRLYGRGDWLIPFKDNHPREIIKKETDKMNMLSKECFIELEYLMEYLRHKEYV